MSTLLLTTERVYQRTKDVKKFIFSNADKEMIFYMVQVRDKQGSPIWPPLLQEAIYHADERKPQPWTVPPNCIAMTTELPDVVLPQLAALIFGVGHILTDITEFAFPELPKDEIAPYNVYISEPPMEEAPVKKYILKNE